MPGNNNRVRLVEDLAEGERLRTEILTEVDAAIARGWRSSHIGFILSLDVAFIGRLRGEHRFRLTTLLRAYSNLPKIAGIPPAEAWSQTARMMLTP